MCILQQIFDTDKSREWKFIFRSATSGRSGIIAYREKLNCIIQQLPFHESELNSKAQQFLVCGGSPTIDTYFVLGKYA